MKTSTGNHTDSINTSTDNSTSNDDLNHDEIQTSLQEDFHHLIALVESDDANSNNNQHDFDNILQSLITTLQQYQLRQQVNHDTNDTHNFIRTNLVNYANSSNSLSSSSTKKSSNTTNHDSEDVSLTLRSIFHSKATITKVLHILIHIMTQHHHNNETYYNTDNHDDTDDNTDNDDDDHDDTDGNSNDITSISIKACHVYLLLCSLSGSWSAGWIDLVAMRYVETIVRKWKVFCCEYQLKLNNNMKKKKHCGDERVEDDDEEEDYEAKVSSRSKRGRYQIDDNEEEEETMVGNDKRSKQMLTKEKIIYSKIHHGIELSNTLSDILFTAEKCKFWNWNIEARDAFFDSIVIALSSCSALIPKLDGKEGMKVKKCCHDSVANMSRSLESIIVSSVVCGIGGNCYEGNHDNDDHWNEANAFSPSMMNSVDDSVDQKEMAKETTITVLRNLYPLLTYQVDLPNGVRGKQAAFEQCQSIIANIVNSLSSHLKSTYHRHHVTPSKVVSIHTPSNTETSNIVKTPVTGQRNIGRLSITPKSTNRKKLYRKSNDFDPLIIPPSLKKSVTPKRTSHRKLVMVQNPSSTGIGTHPSTSQKSKEDAKQEFLQQILDIFVAMMQKLATGQNNNMERVEVRMRISTFITCILDNMKIVQRTAFVQFVIRLCSSKVSSHRIFGVELLCSILAMSWIWEDNVSINVDYDESTDVVENNITTSACKTNTSFGEGQSSEFPHNPSISFLSVDTKSKSHLSRDILLALKGRVMDRSPAVRARVAIALSTALREIQITLAGSNDEKRKVMMLSMKQAGPDLISSLRQRAKGDDKATVRKAALLAFVDLLLVDYGNNRNEIATNDAFHLTHNDVKVLCHLCNDPSIVVRKAAVDSILQFIEQQHHLPNQVWKYDLGSLEVAWVNFLLPLVRDIESSCVSKIVESFESLIIAPILEFDMNESDCAIIDDILASRYWSTWKILATSNYETFSTGGSTGTKHAINVVIRKYFEELDTRKRNQVCITLFRQLKSVIVHTISYQNSSLNDKFVGAWCLLEAIGSLTSNNQAGSFINLHNLMQKSGIGTEFLMDSCSYLLGMDGVQLNRKALIVSAKSFLHVVSSFAHVMDIEQIQKVACTLKDSTKSFHLVLDLIAPSATALVSLATAVCRDKPESAIASLCTNWIKEIFYKCEANLNSYVSTDTKSIDVSTLSRVIFTTGEMCLIGFKQNEGGLGKSGEKDKSCDPIQGLNVRPSNRLIHLIQTLLPLTLPSTDCVQGKEINHVLRAHAFVAFGKICLRDESLAKESLNIFAQELHQTGSKSNSAVRSNALLVLGDFCVCYTHLVNKFLPLMTTCLQSYGETGEASIVCQHAIILFSNLLLQDYIKWKGFLFYRFVSAAVSKNIVVATLAKSLLCGPLLVKQPQLFSSNFIDMIFVLNGCKSHPIHSAKVFGVSYDSQADDTRNLKVNDFDERMKLYNLLLDHMSDEEKIGVTARLAKDVLQSATGPSGHLSLAASTHGGVQDEQNIHLYGAYCVLSDCFSILTNPRLQIGRTRQVDFPEEDEVNDSMVSLGPNATQLNSVKGKLLTKISRKHMIETVVPILCNLKVILEKSRSPLLKHLMGYLVCIFRQFKQEVNEVLASNITLLQEIQYDTRQFEKNQHVDHDMFVSIKA